MIQAGDLVMVVRPTPCCQRAALFGRVFSVIRVDVGDYTCGCCGREIWASFAYRGHGALPFSMLIKIDSPQVDVGTTNETRVEA